MFPFNNLSNNQQNLEPHNGPMLQVVMKVVIYLNILKIELYMYLNMFLKGHNMQHSGHTSQYFSS